MNNISSYNIAVLIPCYNESKTIVKVIHDFKKELPGAQIFVFDNNSDDGSFQLAKNSGATVIREKRQGKGFVVSSMLKTIVAEIYVLVDADDTYPAERVQDLISPVITEEADMVVGMRLSEYSDKAFRSFHVLGNKLVCGLINIIFSSKLQDPMSGYRVFTKEVALEIPVVAFGFDVETEMTIQMLYRKFIIKELPIPYRDRPFGSKSKLNTFKDGFLVLRKIFSIARAYKPLTFFGGAGILFVILSVIVGSLAISQYYIIQYNYILALIFISIFSFFTGIIFGAVGIIIHTLNFRLLELSNTVIKLGQNYPTPKDD